MTNDQKYTNLYSRFLKRHLNLKQGLRVIFDASNGSGGLLFRALTANVRKLDVTFINDRPDGNFPAHGPDPLAPGASDQLAAAVRRQRADLGVILDNDGDRAFFMDETGRLLTATETLVFLGAGGSGPVVADFLIGSLAHRQFKKQKRKVVVSRVGLYFVKQAVAAHGAALAGEYSGHYYFQEINGSDCGVMAAVQFINRLSRLPASNGRPPAALSVWLSGLPRYHQRIVNFPYVRESFPQLAHRLERRFKRSAKKISVIDGIKIEFADHWFNLRPSNTEDLIRLTVEAETARRLESTVIKLKNMLS